jgi:hypothetical protein
MKKKEYKFDYKELKLALQDILKEIKKKKVKRSK